MNLSAMFGFTLVLFGLIVARTYGTDPGIESSDPANSMDCPAQEAVDTCFINLETTCRYQPFSCPGSEEVIFVASCNCLNGQFLCALKDIRCDDEQVPVTVAPVTVAPVTAAPVTAAPVTAAPVTAAPGTAAPVTVAPGTAAPDTDSTSAPTSSAFFMGAGLFFCLVFIPLIF